MNLAELYVTPQRRSRAPGINLSDAVHAMSPSHQAQRSASRDRQKAQDQFDEGLLLQKDQFENEMTLQKDQFAATTTLQKDQLARETALANERLALERRAAAEAAAQAEKGQIIQATGTGAMGLYLAKDAIKPAAKGLAELYGGTKSLLTGAPSVAEGAAVASETALTAGGGDLAGWAAAEGAKAAAPGAAPAAGAAPGAGSGAASWVSGNLGTMGIITAVIAGQHLLSNQTDRTVEGVKTDDVFGGHFFTEPWMAYGADKLGFDDPTSGEKMDAAIENSDWGNVAVRVPATANQWANPVGDFAYQGAKEGVKEVFGTDDQTTDLIMMAVDPVTASAKILEDSWDDVEDVAEEAWDVVTGDSWLCSETNRRVGLPFSKARSLLRFRRYALAEHRRRTEHYLSIGPALVAAINTGTWETDRFYRGLKRGMINPVARLVKAGRMEAAYRVYVGMTVVVARRFAPELIPDF
ncbi:MAG: hypothetical protein HGJ94_14095 [Desulfosarcina sp.]|nr:hypothetical protein [Desulfosarcina sp.]MBC2741537.1 hypothetical protein [Desulfosarcina sp.]MBC2764451.1 hypothetical protein [Desulfosarcina sp.]